MFKKDVLLFFFALLLLFLCGCSSPNDDKVIHNKIALKPDGRLALLKKVKIEEGNIFSIRNWSVSDLSGFTRGRGQERWGVGFRVWVWIER